MAMTINQITIENFGGIAHLAVSLDEHIHLMETSYVEEMIVILTRLLSVEPQLPVSASWIRDGTRVNANVYLSDKQYTVNIDTNEKKSEMTLKAFDSDGNDKTSEYCLNLMHCIEEDDLTVFSGCDPEITERLYHYMDEETFYPQKSLSKLTDGCSNTNSFRLWLRRYIKDTPQEIPNDEMQYRLLCHLKALEFWDGFEDIRNLHYVRKPFIVKDYGEHSENQNTLFDRAKDTGRQVIVLLPVNKEREKAGRKYERRQASRTSQA